MNWPSFATFRRLPGPATTLPAIQSPVVHIVGPAELKLVAGRLVETTPDGRHQATLLTDRTEVVICHGNVSVSGEALARLSRTDTAVAFLSQRGDRLLARITPDGSSRAVVRAHQYAVVANDMGRHRIACEIVREKIHAAAAAVRHYQRQGRREADGDCLKSLLRHRKRAGTAENLAELMGLEGSASALWFRIFGKLLHSPWQFSRRTRRPPRDPVNALLSFAYTLLYNRCATMLEAVGLEPGLGLLHVFRAGRQSLACDLMEPLRIPLVDRFILSLCNRRRVQFDEFEISEQRGCRLRPRGRRHFLMQWERHWAEDQCQRLLSDRIVQLQASFRETAGPQLKLLRSLQRNAIEEIA